MNHYCHRHAAVVTHCSIVVLWLSRNRHHAVLVTQLSPRRLHHVSECTFVVVIVVSPSSWCCRRQAVVVTALSSSPQYRCHHFVVTLSSSRLHRAVVVMPSTCRGKMYCWRLFSSILKSDIGLWEFSVSWRSWILIRNGSTLVDMGSYEKQERAIQLRIISGLL